MVLLFAVAEGEADAFGDEVRATLAALAARPGYLGGRLGRAVDDPGAWVLVLEWAGVGDYRRAVSSFEVRVATAALLARARPLPSAFEVLRTEGPQGVTTSGSDRTDR